MDDRELRSLLEQLHAEIEKSQSVDDEDRALLRHLGADIQSLLTRQEGMPEQVESPVLSRLEESINRYEVTHPELTLLLTKALAILSNAGI